jgi:acetyltransferase
MLVEELYAGGIAGYAIRDDASRSIKVRSAADGDQSMNSRVSAGTDAYPTQWQSVAQTRDGVQYRIRPIRSDDTERERAFIVGLSDASLHNRIMGGLHEPSPAMLERCVHVDYRNAMAFVALMGDGGNESIIGVARYSRSANANEGEFAVVVTDAWQSRGIATTLLHRLFEYAKIQGLTRMRGTILATNAQMLSFSRSFGMQIQCAHEDATLMEALYKH